MTRHTQERFKETRKNIQTMGKAIDSLNLNDSIKCLDFDKITSLKNIYKKIVPLVKKHKGVIYGTTIGASIKNPKIAIRKTDDLDVRFNTEKDRGAFVDDVMKALGTRNYYVKYGHFGAVICRKSDRNTIIDTHVKEKDYNKKTKAGYNVTLKDAHVTLKTKDKKIKEYCNATGESYSVSAQKKYSAVLDDLTVGYSKEEQAPNKLNRIGKDALDVRLYNADAYLKAFNMWKKETDPIKKARLHKIINELGRAILRFSARKDIMRSRFIAENKYIKDKMLDKRTFTSQVRMAKERAIYEKLKKNPNLDLTKFGTEWIEAVPISKTKTFKIEIRHLL